MTHSHQLILASAGTGKTYRLTGRFLDILFDDVPPERILATTFTRKAAGEILDRVLRRLVEATEDAGQRASLAQQLDRELTEDQVRGKLVDLLRSLDRFRVRTLDAFFVQLAKLFALDLGLPPDWSIVEDATDEALRRDALALTLERSDPGELIEILRGMQQADASRSVERVLLDKVKQGRNAFLDSPTAAWKTLSVPKGLASDELGELEHRIEGLELPRTQKGTPRRHWQNARKAMVECVAKQSWKDVLEIGLVNKVVSKETRFDTHPIDAEWLNAIQTLLRHVAHELIAEIDRENLAAHDWLERFETNYESLKREERAYRFEDLPKALHPRDENRLLDQDLVWYRLDGKIDHLLLDEFQDTAPVQWRLLGNLAEEILADGTGTRSFFCVGDVKQSIYGWREAEPRLLAQMHERHPILEPEAMNKSYRSSVIVLETVGRIFRGIGESPVFEDRPARKQAALEFQADFDTPEAGKDLPGAAWLLEAPESEEHEDKHEPVVRLAAHRTREILDEAPGATVGILLRRNDWVPKLIHLLRGEGIRASGEGGNPLVDSAAVLHFVSLLHLSDHPGDTAAAFHVATSPLASAIGLTPQGFKEQREKVAAVVRKRLAVEGYGPFCASFQPIVTTEYGPWDQKRFEQLIDLAHSFEDRAGLRADKFLDYVRVTPVEDPSATQVKVMTIHASKGLEFDAVLLPELDVSISPRKSPLLTRRTDPAGLLDAVSHSRSREVCELDPKGLGVLYADQERRETREALCLLYVAATRARYRLDMLVQRRANTKKPYKSFAGIVIAALAPDRVADLDGLLWKHESNHEPWFPPELGSGASPIEASKALTPSFRDDGSTPLVRRTPSAQEGSGRLTPRDLLRSPGSPPRIRGMLVHRWFQEVEWLEDFDRSDEDLRALGRAITRDSRILLDALAEFRTLLQQPGTRSLLARPEPSDVSHTVWRERAFSVVLKGDDGESELWSGSFDRVVLEMSGEETVGAKLIDYKTDRVEPDDIDERTEYYRPQLDGYARVIRHMTGLSAEKITACLAFLHADQNRVL